MDSQHLPEIQRLKNFKTNKNSQNLPEIENLLKSQTPKKRCPYCFNDGIWFKIINDSLHYKCDNCKSEGKL